ncbi:helicase [Tsukamurella phage TIN2]|uniref:Helicase n=1 Tax=Tsukamurella phage TIN2 TaxID=1636545 RepID=A0A0K0N581_9CAUD|nr:helicase [Tsukamurella phage TIN2]AKJ71741.1 helicase [Tsukamurella phage TIN2]
MKWLKNKKGAILADEMGLGKTIQALFNFGMHVWTSVKKDPEARCIMVAVVPASLRMNWLDEIEKFTHFDYCVATGNSVVERFKQIEEFKKIDNHKILVINYEILGDHIQQINMLKGGKQGIDMLVADEAHVIKNRNTLAYKNITQITRDRTLAMSGTPMTGQVDDLWTLLDFVTPGQWGTFAGFKAKYCVLGGFNGKQVTAVKNERQLNARLGQVMLRREIDNVIDLPEINIIKRMVSLTGKPREMYNHLATEHRLQKFIPSLTDEEDESLEWPMVRQLRFRQICSSTCTLVPGWDESPKLDLAIEDACEILDNGHKLIVFTQFRPIIEAYKRRLEEARPGTKVSEIHGNINKDKRQGIVKEWSADKEPGVIIGIIKAMGVGLNMVAANHCQFIDKEFSPALNDQGIGRLRRVGSEHHPSIQVFEYMVKNSAEYRVEQIIKDKKFSFDAVIRGGATDGQTESFMDKIKDALEGTL